MYNPANAEVVKKVAPGTVIEGAIINIVDGKARDFIKNEVALAKFENPEEPAINVVIEFQVHGKPSRIERLFSYQEVDGVTTYHPKSNLGKFKAFYGAVPAVGMVVKLSSNADGYFKLLM